MLLRYTDAASEVKNSIVCSKMRLTRPVRSTINILVTECGASSHRCDKVSADSETSVCSHFPCTIVLVSPSFVSVYSSNLLSSLQAHLNRGTGTNARMLHTLAISLIGLTLYLGFLMLSTYTALIFSSMAAANVVGSSEVTNLAATPCS